VWLYLRFTLSYRDVEERSLSVVTLVGAKPCQRGMTTVRAPVFG
jgi:hypothetical protein